MNWSFNATLMKVTHLLMVGRIYYDICLGSYLAVLRRMRIKALIFPCSIFLITFKHAITISIVMIGTPFLIQLHECIFELLNWCWSCHCNFCLVLCTHNNIFLASSVCHELVLSEWTTSLTLAIFASFFFIFLHFCAYNISVDF